MELLLTERVFMLMVDGRSPSSADPRIIAGALLLDLERQGHVEWRDGRLVVDKTTESPLLERAHTVIAGSPTARDAKGWLKHLPKQLGSINADLARSLVERGLLNQSTRRSFGVLTRTRLDAVGVDLDQALRRQLVPAFEAGVEPDEEGCLLIVLIFPYDTLVTGHSDKRAKAAQAWITAIYNRWTRGTTDPARPARAAILAAIRDTSSGNGSRGTYGGLGA